MSDILSGALAIFASVLVLCLWFVSGVWLTVEVAYARKYPEPLRWLGVCVVIASWCALAYALWALAFGTGQT